MVIPKLCFVRLLQDVLHQNEGLSAATVDISEAGFEYFTNIFGYELILPHININMETVWMLDSKDFLKVRYTPDTFSILLVSIKNMLFNLSE